MPDSHDPEKGRLERLREHFDRELERRERLQNLSREVVRLSARSIFALHRGEEGSAGELLEKARERLEEMLSLAREDPGLLAWGTVKAAQQEYCEAFLVRALLREGRLPEPEEAGVPYDCYLMALADASGELRRAVLDHLRRGELKPAEEFFRQMERIYEFLTEFDYPEAVLPGMKRKQDVVRGLVERTRGELTLSLKRG
jgi:translin